MGPAKSSELRETRGIFLQMSPHILVGQGNHIFLKKKSIISHTFPFNEKKTTIDMQSIENALGATLANMEVISHYTSININARFSNNSNNILKQTFKW